MTDAAKAATALARAEQAIGDARAARDRAHDELDQALADRGWRRATVVQNPGATPLYQHLARPDSLIGLPDVLRIIDLERTAA